MRRHDAIGDEQTSCDEVARRSDGVDEAEGWIDQQLIEHDGEADAVWKQSQQV